MRWRIASAPSLPNDLDPRAPGTPVWDAELFRARGLRPAGGRSRMKRIASIWLPGWRSSAGRRRTTYRLTLRSSSPSRARTGRSSMPSPKPPPTAARRAGARLTDARALDPALVAIPADPEGDAALVERLAKWAGRWSPLVEVDGRWRCGSTSAALRICSAARTGLVEDVQRRFAALGLTARMAIAPTAAAAWALARYSPSPLRRESSRAAEG